MSRSNPNIKYKVSKDIASSSNNSSYISEDDEISDTYNSDNENDSNELTEHIDDINGHSNDTKSKQSELIKNKRVPVKMQKLSIKDALKSVEERSLYTDINRFFTTKCEYKKIQKMVRIINNSDVISLRLLNWFAMKHSATMVALDFVNANNDVEIFDVKISYRARLNTHSKKHFDPFRRGKKFDYNYDKKDKTKVVETTLCQLNFFRWLYMHDLMDYVEENFDNLKNKMGNFNIREKKKKDNKKKKENIIKCNLKDNRNESKHKVKYLSEGDINKIVIIM